MHIERIHFDEVFDVTAKRGQFSFRSGGRTFYGIDLQRGLRRAPVPRAGETYVFAFARQDDWSTVLGWLDAGAQTVTFREPVWLAVLLGLGSLSWYGPFLLAGALVIGGAGAALAVLLAICGFACWRLWHVVSRNRQVCDALLGRAPALAA